MIHAITAFLGLSTNPVLSSATPKKIAQPFARCSVALEMWPYAAIVYPLEMTLVMKPEYSDKSIPHEFALCRRNND
ncbi:MAG: hypothetical protein AAF098_19155 [Pseudomonadota bacterium]